jgi:orotate phosphoribosyltransferase
MLKNKGKTYDHSANQQVNKQHYMRADESLNDKASPLLPDRPSTAGIMNTIHDLKQLLIERSVRTGDFILASGKSSSFYVDARMTTMSPEGLALIGPLSLDLIENAGWTPDSVGGLTLGADPVSFSISRASVDRLPLVRAFTVRKQAKTHGIGNLIEGPFRSGDKVVVVEDVVTTGKSALQAIDAVVQAGANVLGVLAVVNRNEGGVKAIHDRGFETVFLVSIDELLS